MVGGACVAAGLLGAAAGSAFADEPHRPTAGKFHADAYQADGSLDLRQVPEYVETLDRQGNLVGYVDTDRMLNPDTDPDEPLGGYDLLDERTWDPVLDGDLKTVVGHMVPSYGFLPLGDAPPDRSELAQVTEIIEKQTNAIADE